MAGAKKARRGPPSAVTADSAAPALAELKLFHDGGGRNENFSFTRAYWAEGHERESMSGRIDRKVHPVRSATGEILASAATIDLVLPLDAPQEYMCLNHLIRRYEETLPKHEVNAYAQVTIRFPGTANLIEPFEMVRAWVRSHFTHVPVLVVLHAPHLWGSSNPGHCHCIAWPRRANFLGWAEIERTIASDAGQREAYDSWLAFQEIWRHAQGR